MHTLLTYAHVRSRLLKVAGVVALLPRLFGCGFGGSAAAPLKGRGLGGSLLRGQRTQVANEYVLYAVAAPSCEGSATLILLQLNIP